MFSALFDEVGATSVESSEDEEEFDIQKLDDLESSV